VRNLEFKAPLDDSKRVLSRARELGADLWGDLRQTDTYFSVPHGRLKLRETAGFQGELVYYERDEWAADRPSDYQIAHVVEPATMLDVLERALGMLAVVRKRRTLLLLDTARIHLDNIEGLGSFLEIEVPVKDGEAGARARIDSLIYDLGYAWSDCIRASYLDLMLAAQEADS
jgi:predicted adenylyl cyclase CyaB